MYGAFLQICCYQFISNRWCWWCWFCVNVSDASGAMRSSSLRAYDIYQNGYRCLGVCHNLYQVPNHSSCHDYIIPPSTKLLGVRFKHNLARQNNIKLRNINMVAHMIRGWYLSLQQLSHWYNYIANCTFKRILWITAGIYITHMNTFSHYQPYTYRLPYEYEDKFSTIIVPFPISILLDTYSSIGLALIRRLGITQKGVTLI